MNKTQNTTIEKDCNEDDLLLTNFDIEELEMRYEMGWLSKPFGTGSGTAVSF